MCALFHPLFNEDDHKKSRHYELETFHIDVNQRTEYSANGSAKYPVAMIKRGYEKHVPPLVHFFGDVCRVIN
ncbi:hypothetical protein D3C73_1585620 [compost metagenome]